MTLYTPETYQRTGIQFLIDQPAAGMFADPGGGKTAMMLAAFSVLKKRGLARRMLIIAPRLVCWNVWPFEIDKWDQFKKLKIEVIHGDDKAQKLFKQVIDPTADVCCVNPEAVDYLLSFFPESWFARKDPPISWPWDFLVIDESSKFKNPSSVRFKTLKHFHKLFTRRAILTGTPAPNGLMDLWSQVYLLDSGAALGKTITEYRNTYFTADTFGNFTRYTLRPGAAEQIHAAIAHLVIRFDASTFADLPSLVINDVRVTLPEKVAKFYAGVESEMFGELDGGDLLVPNASAKYLLCRQIANGNYYDPDTREVKPVHGEKIEALKDLIDELQGKPALVAYYFRHDLAALRAALGASVPVIGSDTPTAEINRLLAAWNAGTLPILLVHPDSMAHGLNMQAGGLDLIFYSLIDNLENYQQLIARLHRRGAAGQVRVHRLIAVGTIDRAVCRALDSKAATQSALLDAIRAYRAEKARKDDLKC